MLWGILSNYFIYYVYYNKHICEDTNVMLAVDYKQIVDITFWFLLKAFLVYQERQNIP